MLAVVRTRTGRTLHLAEVERADEQGPVRTLCGTVGGYPDPTFAGPRVDARASLGLNYGCSRCLAKSS